MENYALYMAVKARFGMVSWLDWPDEEIRLHRADAVKKYGEEHPEEEPFIPKELGEILGSASYFARRKTSHWSAR